MVIDVQNGVVAHSINRDATVSTIAALVDRARAEKVPVVWVQHSDDEALTQGSEAWQYVPELRRRDPASFTLELVCRLAEDTARESKLLHWGPDRSVGLHWSFDSPTDSCR